MFLDVDEVPSSHDDWVLALSVLDSRIEWRPNGGRDHIFFFALYNSLSGSVPTSRTRARAVWLASLIKISCFLSSQPRVRMVSVVLAN